MNLKERIQELCKQNNISMNKVETDLEFGKGYISKLGKSTPNVIKIQKIADYFGVPIEYLMKGDVSNNKTPQLEPQDKKDINEFSSEIRAAARGMMKLSPEDQKTAIDMINYLSQKGREAKKD